MQDTPTKIALPRQHRHVRCPEGSRCDDQFPRADGLPAADVGRKAASIARHRRDARCQPHRQGEMPGIALQIIDDIVAPRIGIGFPWHRQVGQRRISHRRKQLEAVIIVPPRSTDRGCGVDQQEIGARSLQAPRRRQPRLPGADHQKIDVAHAVARLAKPCRNRSSPSANSGTFSHSRSRCRFSSGASQSS